jgi:hypothetical protein
MGRYKSSDRMKFGLLLATAESKQVFHCYATHGKAYGRAIPNFAADVRIVVINAARQAHWDDATFDPYKRFQCAVLSDPRDWRLLGWAMADGSLPKPSTTFAKFDPKTDPPEIRFVFADELAAKVLTVGGPLQDEFGIELR